MKMLKVNEIVNTISETHSFNTSKLFAINTSDVLEGELLNPNFIEVDDLKGQFKKTIKKDDILFSEIRPANKRFAKVTWDNTENYVASTKLMVLRKFNDEVDLDYFYYWLTNDIMLNILQMRAENRICSFPQITFELLSEYSVPVPEVYIQKKIASQLRNIDRKIRTNNHINSELESMAKTLYDYWFLQFDFPNKEGKPYKSSGGKLVYNEELKREIPEGWEVANLIDNPLSKVIKAGVDEFKKKNYLPTANIEGELITDGDYVTFENRESRANMQPKLNSVWFAKMKNSIKHLSIPSNGQWFIDKYILSTGYEGIQCSDDSFAYIHSIINSSYFEKYKDTLSHGATQEGVNDEDLKNVKFVIPDNKILNRYASILNPILEKKFAQIKENQQLTELRDFLLPMLMNGQVTFKEDK